jgi:predicted ester cyclase
MITQENEAKVRAFYEEAVNRGNLSAIDNLVAPIEIAHYSGGLVGQNTPDLVKQWVVDLRSAFPDIHVTIEELMSVGDKVINRVTYHGTHNGVLIDATWGLISPTGKRIEWMAIAINRFSAGKSVEAWDLIDDPGIWRQLGIIPIGNQREK